MSRETPVRPTARPRGEERFMDRGDAHSQRRRAYERKSRVFKRQRAQAEPTSEQRVVQILLDLNERGSDLNEQRLGTVVQQLQPLIKDHGETVKECLIECAVELPAGTPHYAALIGSLWRTEHQPWVTEFLEKAKNAFCTALAKSLRLRARMLLRFFVRLATVQVVEAPSLLALLNQIIDAAIIVAQSSRDKSGRSWQPYSDFLVYSTLMSLPWGAAAVFGDSPSAWEAFSVKVEHYIAQRSIQRDVATSPFLVPLKEGDAAAQSDSGGPSFVVELWSAIKDLQSMNQWQCKAIPNIQIRPAETVQDSAGIDLKEVVIPTSPPGCTEDMSLSECAVAVAKLYPPRGGIHLLEAQHTHPDALDIDKIIIEEYVLDTLSVYSNSRVDCVQRIARDIPAPFPIFPLVAQTLFSQLLLLPRPPLQPVTYAAVIINLCKVDTVSRCIFLTEAAVLGEVFARLSVLDPELVRRAADWLSLHLSNLGFMWPWEKWKKVIDAPPHSAQRLFVQQVLQGLVDLSYLKLVQNNLSPAEFHVLLPAEPAPKAFEEMFEVMSLEQDEGTMDVDSGQEKPKCQDTEMAIFQQLGNMMSAKEPADRLRQALNPDLLSTPEKATSLMQGMCRILFVCASKNVTHTATLLGRYSPLLMEITSAVGDTSDEIWIEALMDVWEASLQRATLILKLLMEQEIIQAPSLVRWAFNQIQKNCDEENAAVSGWWELVYCSLSFAESYVKEAENQKSDAAVQVVHAKEIARDAAARAAEAAERLESGATQSVQETIEAINEASAAEERARSDVISAEEHLRIMDAEGMNPAMALFQTVFLTVVEGFLFLLKEKPEWPSEETPSQDACRIYYRTVSKLGAICRLYVGRVLPFLHPLEVLLSERAANEVVQRVVWNSLRVGKDIEPTESVYDVHFFVKRRESATPGPGPRMSESSMDAT